MSHALGAQAIGTLAAFMVLLGALAFLARPGAALNRTLAALLLLHGSAETMTFLMHGAPSRPEYDFYHRMSQWYEAAVPFLTLLLLHRLVPPEGRAPWRRWALGAVALASVLLSPVPAMESLRGALTGATGEGGHGPLGDASLALLWGSRAFAVAVAAWAASSPARGLLQRQQAGLVGLAFTFLMGYSASEVVVRATLGGRLSLWATPSTFVAAAWLLVAALALPRLAQPFEARWRRVVLAAGLVPFALGPWQFYLSAQPWYVNARFLMIGAYTACLAVAIVRYDLTGMGPRVQRRVGVFSRGMLAFGALLLPMGVTLLVLGVSSMGLTVALVLGTGALAISPSPARVLARGFTRVFAPDPADPAVAAERARLYAEGLRRHPEGSPALERLREDLGLAEPDRAALARLLDPRGEGRPPRDPPLLGRYLVQEELGRGASGAVLLARDLATGGAVVLKSFHAGWTETRALAEAEALAKVRHPRVVPLLSVERAGDRVFLVMEHVPGGTAQALLDAEGPLPPARALALAMDALEGLEAVHAAGLAHGDVKPANLLLDAEGRALVADLGAAQALARAASDLTLTVTPVLGTYATVAPEVLRGARRTPAADVYSTGAVLYRLLTREDYVQLPEKDLVGATDAIQHAPPRLPHPLVPAAVEPVLAKALAKPPSERYASAREMRDALARAAKAAGPG